MDPSLCIIDIFFVLFFKIRAIEVNFLEEGYLVSVGLEGFFELALQHKAVVSCYLAGLDGGHSIS